MIMRKKLKSINKKKNNQKITNKMKKSKVLNF